MLLKKYSYDDEEPEIKGSGIVKFSKYFIPFNDWITLYVMYLIVQYNIVSYCTK